ncbi:MAG TPA: AraC family transcriptional regulator [Polyangiaceae bacterium]|nr:AraC family transcriptional regulator [Polyangiaceae bacterium]
MAPVERADATFTVAASAVRGLVAYAEARGVPAAEALAAVSLEPSALAGAEARVTQATYNRLWARLAAASGDDDFGLHFAERLDFDALDVVGHLVAKSATFGQGLERVVAYSRLLHDAGRVELEREGDGVRVYPGCRGLTHEWPRHVAEFSAAAVVVLGRVVTGVAWAPRGVDFRHAKPARADEHRRIFGVAPRFRRPETSVVLGADVLALPVREAQAGVLTYLDAYARGALERLGEADDPLTASVERAVARAMERGAPDLEPVAAQLGLSPRTLQRRLAEAGTSFQALADGVRRAYAERYLADDRLALAEVGFLLGFSDPSNFHRAFRRWTGTTPAAFRAARRMAPGDKGLSR